MDPALEVLRNVFMALALAFPESNIEGVEFDQEPLFCMAQNIYHEARDQDFDGMAAIAHVTLNRVKHSDYENDICRVVYEGRYFTNWKGNLTPRRHQCQFSWWCDGKSDKIWVMYEEGDAAGVIIEPNMEAWKRSIQAAILVILKIYPDITNGATHYYNPALAKPDWRNDFPVVANLGNHRFSRKAD